MLEDYINERITQAYIFMHNDSQKALKILDEILEIEPENIEAVNCRGSTLMKLKRMDEAETQFNQSLSLCENSSAFLNKANICRYRKDYEKALFYYDKATEINPNLENIVNILKEDICSPEADFNEFNDKAEELIRKGIELKGEKKLWESLETFMKAVEADPACKNRANGLADEIVALLEKEFIYEESEFDMKNKIDRVKMQAQRAINKENNHKKALILMNLVLEMDETDLNTLNRKGGVLFICRNYQEAIECFDKCLSIDENYYGALFNKAIVLRLLNRLTEALNCFDELLKMPQYYNKVKAYQLEIIKKLHTENKT